MNKFYNSCILRIIEESIAAYYNKAIPLIYLMENIEVLPMLMNDTSEDWQNDIVNESYEMDVIYATILDKERVVFTQQEQESFEESIRKVAALIKQFKKEHGSSTTTSPLIYPQ